MYFKFIEAGFLHAEYIYVGMHYSPKIYDQY
jgi:hypothetical protein